MTEKQRQIQRRIRRKNRIKKRMRKMKLIFGVELLCILGMLVLLLSKGFASQNVSAEKYEGKYEEFNSPVNEPDGDGEYSEISDGRDSDSEDAEKENILLVNKNNRLPEDYSVKLITMPDRVNKAAEEAYEPLCDMLTAGRKEGLSFEICSSYRSVERQQELFDEDLNKLIRAGYTYQEAYEEVAKETMPPGHSEHSTGLAFDIVSLGYQILDDGQEKTAENKWLQEHCAEYGFILRYPRGKEDITDISYESWHFRYVGVEAAEYIMENGITLEEYLEGTKNI